MGDDNLEHHDRLNHQWLGLGAETLDCGGLRLRLGKICGERGGALAIIQVGHPKCRNGHMRRRTYSSYSEASMHETIWKAIVCS